MEAIIIGSGPNGLAAGITLAREGWKVSIIEKHSTPGGGARTEEGPLPGFYRDVCSAVFPMAVCSPFFRELDLKIDWIDPEILLAHPLDDGSAAVMHRSIEETADQFSSRDSKLYQKLFSPLLANADSIFDDLLAPPKIPSNPIAVAKFGIASLRAPHIFQSESAKALFAGNAAHAVQPLHHFPAPGAIATMLMLAGHRAGWPIAQGGAQSIVDALANKFTSLGGTIECDRHVTDLDDLPKVNAYLFDTAPTQLAEISGDQLPSSFRSRLTNYKHGPGVFKIDYALSEPVPWTAGDCRKAGTVHVGGTKDEIATSEQQCWEGKHPEKPFVLCAQPSLFDSTRAPEGNHTFWAYCHVPSHSDVDMTDAIENQIERFAPGFRDIVLARSKTTCREFETYNPNYIGGDIVGGVANWKQLLTRPVVRLRPHTTPNKSIYICSASSPPGAGIHGMCGYHAANAALQRSIS